MNRANEQSTISKIVENESEGISQLKLKMQSFIGACNTETTLVDLLDVATQPDDFKKLLLKIKMDDRNKRIRLCSIELLSELKTCPENEEVVNLVKLVSQYGECFIELTQKIRESTSADDAYKKKANAEKDLIKSFSDYISSREALLNKVLLEYLPLDQIKAMYSEHLRKDDC